jgi:hypothetical protein
MKVQDATTPRTHRARRRTTGLDRNRGHVVRRVADLLREQAKAAGLTIERHVAGRLLEADDLDADALGYFLSALGCIAAEDDRRGAGPLREVEAATRRPTRRPTRRQWGERTRQADAAAVAWAAQVPADMPEALVTLAGRDGVLDQLVAVLTDNAAALTPEAREGAGIEAAFRLGAAFARMHAASVHQ